MAHKVKIAISIDPALLKRVDSAAESLKMSRSRFIDNALAEALSESESVTKAMGNEVVRDAFYEAMTQPGVLRGLAEAMGAKLSGSDLAAAQSMLGHMKPTAKPGKRKASKRSGG
jgi:predicted transcriptional regulator